MQPQPVPQPAAIERVRFAPPRATRVQRSHEMIHPYIHTYIHARIQVQRSHEMIRVLVERCKLERNAKEVAWREAAALRQADPNRILD